MSYKKIRSQFTYNDYFAILQYRDYIIEKLKVVYGDVISENQSNYTY